MLARYRPFSGVRISGICCEWFTSGTGWAYCSRKSQLLRTHSCLEIGIKFVQDSRKQLLQFLLAHRKVGMVSRYIITAVNDVVAPIMCFVDIVCMFDKGQEGDFVFTLVRRVRGDV